MFAEKGRDLHLKRREIQTGRIAFDLVEIQCARQLVLAHEVDLVLPFPIPPAGRARIAAGLQELPSEVHLERTSRELIEITFDKSGDRRVLLLFKQMKVLVDEAEPEPEEAVIDPIQAVARRDLLVRRLDLLDQRIGVLQLRQLSADLGADHIPDLGIRRASGGNRRQDGEVNATVLAELLSENDLSLIDIRRTETKDRFQHLLPGEGLRVQQELDIPRDTTRQRPERRRPVITVNRELSSESFCIFASSASSSLRP